MSQLSSTVAPTIYAIPAREPSISTPVPEDPTLLALLPSESLLIAFRESRVNPNISGVRGIFREPQKEFFSIG